MHSRPARALRGLAAAGFATLVAAIAHVLAGGAPPHPLLLALVVLAGGLVGSVLAGRRVQLIRIAPPVAVSQGLFHLLFSASSTGASVAGGSSAPGVALTSGHGAHDLALAIVGGSGAPSATGGRMLAAHVAAALITMLALRYGEAAFWGLLDTGRLMLARLLTFPAHAPSWVAVFSRRTDGDRRAAPRPQVFLTGDPRRGPPQVRPA